MPAPGMSARTAPWAQPAWSTPGWPRSRPNRTGRVRWDGAGGSVGPVNARLAWISPKPDWAIAAWGTNTSDKTYFPGAVATGDTIGHIALQKSPVATAPWK